MKSNAMRSTQWQCAVVSSWLLLAHPLWAGETPTTEASPLTVAEKSGFRATSRSAEVIEFINTIARQADHVRSFEFGRTVEDRSLMCTVVTQPPVREASALANDPRLVVLLIGNIHSGECAGKEALLMLLRELSHEPDDQWLHNLILLFVPNYNADGNDAVSRDNRPGQVGPAAGMGRRENAQGLDLNRDYMKLDTPECRALVGLINQWDPGLVIDMHTTNGSQHRYALTYDVPHNPASPASLRGFMRQEMMPAITSTLEHQGVATFYYGNFNRDHTRWTTFGDAPRYGTEYVGLRGRMSILSEAYAYITYEERIKASREFARQCLDFTALHAQAIRTQLDHIRIQSSQSTGDSASQDLVPIRSRVTALPEHYSVRGYVMPSPQDDAHDHGKPAVNLESKDYDVQFLTRYEPTLTVRRPAAYLIPAGQKQMLERLRCHGVKFHRLANDGPQQVQYYIVKSVKLAQRPYQGHVMRQLEVETKLATREIPRGTIVVPTDQPLSNLIVYLLEPCSDDGFAAWDLVEPAPEAGSEFPVLRTPAR